VQMLGTLRDDFRRGLTVGVGSGLAKTFGLFRSKFRSNIRKFGGGPLAVAAATAVELTVGLADWLVRNTLKWGWQGAGAWAGGAIGAGLGGPLGATAGAAIGATVGKYTRMGVHTFLPKMNPTGWVRGAFDRAVINPLTRPAGGPSAVRRRLSAGTRAVIGDVPGNREDFHPEQENAVIAGVTQTIRQTLRKKFGRGRVRTRIGFDPRLPLTDPANATFQAAVKRHIPDAETRLAVRRAMLFLRSQVTAKSQVDAGLPAYAHPEAGNLKAFVRQQWGGTFAEARPVPTLDDLLAGVADLFRSMGKPLPPESVLMPALAGALHAMAGGVAKLSERGPWRAR